MENKNNWVKTTLLILIVILIGLLSYIAYNSFLKEDEEINQNQQLSLLDPTVELLYSYVKGSDVECLLYNDYLLKNKDLTVNTFDNEEKYFFSWGLLDTNDFEIETINDTFSEKVLNFTISYDDYDKAIKKLFGDDVTYSTIGKHSFDLDFYTGNYIEFSYDESSNEYVGSVYGMGGTCDPINEVYRELTEAIKTQDGIILTEKFIYTDAEYDCCSDGASSTVKYKIYADYNKSILIYESAWIDQDTLEYEDWANLISIDDYLDEANTITYTFKLKPDGSYYFVSSSVEK
ncbi:MAG TPA: hypothetical protein PLX66_02465 [Bacilli bacterium]|nr:hypothetical protein [Bacilli bacterium]